ncbi:MAG: PD-(D/E)XK nuclease family protein [Candidatus Daviesbacteria bacterium]|nr:PD-(D/E)XK nuclease family protein [Candidatus Daviesbacteria bacterium]
MIPKQKQEYIKDALWISYTALKDFTRCPRSYFLKNRYRDTKTGNRLQVASAPMTLGSLVHDAIKWYLQTGRVASKDDVVKQYKNHWLKYRGKRGGFSSREEEADFGKRGLKMLDNFMENVKLLEANILIYDFLRFRLDEKIVLNGKVDFVGELPDKSLHILDFKTGSKEEDDSTQLHTYAILAESNLQKKVSKISYWYLDRESVPKEAVLDRLEDKLEWLRDKALQIKKAIKENNWVCINGDPPVGGLCNDCRNYQAIIDGKGEFQFSDESFKKDIYFLDQAKLE